MGRRSARDTAFTTRSAIWARPGVVYHPGLNRIYVGTGNGSYNGNTGGRNWSESVLALNPDGTGAGGRPLDSYTPPNFQALDNADADLGSTAPAILPVPAASNVPALAVQGGKDALLRLLNLTNLSGSGGPGQAANFALSARVVGTPCRGPFGEHEAATLPKSTPTGCSVVLGRCYLARRYTASARPPTTSG